MTTPRVLMDGLGDITDLIVFEQTELNISAQGEASPSTMVARDIGGSPIEFKTGFRITVDIGGDVIWAGYLLRAERRFWFDADTQTTTNRRWDLSLADLNILFSKRVVYNKAIPKVIDGPSYRDPTFDDDIIDELVTNWLDLSADDIDTSSLVERVGVVNPSSGSCTPPDQNFYPFNGSMQWGEAMEIVSQVPAAIYGFLPGGPIGDSPFAKLFYVDVDSADAPLDLTDNPTTSGQAGYRDLTIWDDGTELVNEAFEWGAGKGTNHLVFETLADATSITDHGLWQEGDLLFNIWCQDTIEKVADTIINGSPSSRRGHKNPITSVELTTDTDGFRVGQKARVINAEYGFDQVLPIRRMGISFPTQDHARYSLRLSEALDRWGFQDPPSPFKSYRNHSGGHGGGNTQPDCGITDRFHRVGDPGVSDAGVAWVEVNGNDPDPSGVSYAVDGSGLVATADDTSVEWSSIDLPLPQEITQFETRIIVSDYPDPFLSYIVFQTPGALISGAPQVYLYNYGGSPHIDVLDHSASDSQPFDFDGRAFHIKAQVGTFGTRARWWYVGDSEPSSWLVSVANGEHHADFPPAVSFECDGFDADGDSIKFSSLQVVSLEHSMLEPFSRSVSSGDWGTSPDGYVWTPFTNASGLSVDGSAGRLLDDGTRTEVYTSDPSGPWNAESFRGTIVFEVRDVPTAPPDDFRTTDLNVTIGVSSVIGIQIAATAGPPNTGFPKSYIQFFNTTTFIPPAFWVAGGVYTLTIRRSGTTLVASVARGVDLYSVSDVVFASADRLRFAMEFFGPSGDQLVKIHSIAITSGQNLVFNRCYEFGSICWVNPTGYLDDFNRSFIDPDPAASFSDVGCTTHGSYPWIHDNMSEPTDTTLVVALNGGLDMTLYQGGDSTDYDNGSGFDEVGGGSIHVHLPVDGKKWRLEFTAQMTQGGDFDHDPPNSDPEGIASQQNRVSLLVDVYRHPAPFNPSALDSPSTDSLSDDIFFELHDIAGEVSGNSWGCYAFLQDDIPGSMSNPTLFTSQRVGGQGSFSSGTGVVLERDGDNLSLTVGSLVQTTTITTDESTGPGESYMTIEFGTDLRNEALDWGPNGPSQDRRDWFAANPNSAFRVRISELRFTADDGNCVSVPPRTGDPDLDGPCA